MINLINNRLYWIGILCGSVGIIFLPSIWGKWYFDDYFAILGNPDIQSWEGITRSLGNFGFRSIVQLSYAFDYALNAVFDSGRENYSHNLLSPLIFHITSLILHLVTVSGLFLFLQKFIDLLNFPEKRFSFIFSVLVAFLFGIHPITTEAVNYLSARSSLLIGLESVWGMYFFLCFIEHSQWFPTLHIGRIQSVKKTYGFFLASVFCFVLGIGTKLTIFSFPLMILLILLVIEGHRTSWLDTLYRLRFIFPLVIALLVSFLAYHLLIVNSRVFKSPHSSNSWWMSFLLSLVGGDDVTIRSSWVNLLSQIGALWGYYLPRQLCLQPMCLDPQVPEIVSIFHFHFILGSITLILLIGLALFAIQKNPLLTLGIGWYLITLIPTSSIVPLYDLVAERRLYLPHIGFTIALVAVGQSFWRFFSTWPRAVRYAQSILLVTLCLCIILTIAQTVHRNLLYTDPIRFWEDTILHAPQKARPYVHLGNEYWKAGKAREALNAYKQALQINPYLKETALNIGNIFANEFHDYRNAEIVYRQCITLWPEWDFPKQNLGAILILQKEWEKARQLSIDWLNLYPQSPSASIFKADFLYSQGQYEDAEKIYLEHIDQSEDRSSVYMKLSDIARRKGNDRQSIEYQNRAKSFQKDETHRFWEIANTPMTLHQQVE